MALAFPLSASAFATGLRVRDVRFELQTFVETSGTGRGEIITSEIAAPKWAATVSLARASNRDADAVQALFEAILPHGTFALYNVRRPFPIADPTGSILGTRAVEIHSVGTDNKSMSLDGLPGGYVISRGDMLAFDRPGTPARRSLHRVIETVTALSSGVTPIFEVRPHLKSGTAVGLAVNLKRPAALMMVQPGTYSPGTAGKLFTEGAAFTAIEI